MQKRLFLYAAIIAFTLSLYGSAEARGWARGGKKAPDSVDPAQLRNTNPGSWTFLYWAHGSRGK